MGGTSHQYVFQGGEREDNLMSLRNVGDLFCDISPAKFSDIMSVQENIPALKFHQADKAFNESGLASAVRAEDAQALPCTDGKLNVFKDPAFAVIGEGRIDDLQNHSHPTLRSRSR